jgi:hypothetical protein
MKWTKLIAITFIAFCLISWMVVSSETDLSSFESIAFDRVNNELIVPEDVFDSNKTIEKLATDGDKVYAKPINETIVYVIGNDGLRPVNNMPESDKSLIIQWGIRDGAYYQADVRTRKITERKGKSVSQFTVSTPFTRIIRLDNGNYLVKRLSGKGDADDYYVFKKNIAPDLHFGNLLIDRNDGGFANDGFFISNAHGTYFHISYYQSDIIAFDETGSPFYKTMTLDRSAVAPPTIQTNAGHRYISPKAILVNKCAAANSKHLFILSNLYAGKEKDLRKDRLAVIDVYSIYTGAYIRSFHLPESINAIKSIAVTEDDFYYAGRKTISTVRLQNVFENDHPKNNLITITP